ncbi:integrase [Paraburkholderia sp. BR14263]|uniref:integrase n=1 Tax=unclassified Paraburkholderia TaxID=2615204 RepID=UPI0034CFB978
MPPTPYQQTILLSYVPRLEAAAHGGKGDLIRSLAAELGVSEKSAYRMIGSYLVRDRKRRSDAGKSSLSRTEAITLAAALVETTRANGKRNGSVKQYAEALRCSNLIKAERVDMSTGELVKLSESTLHRALRAYQVHPDQLAIPTPHVNLSSPHPNYCWQADASVCVVYYLPGGAVHIQELKPGVHYKNKPENLEAIERQRVIRYVVTDHCSGVVRWRYYPGAESGEHTVRLLAWAMARKANLADPFHGAPRYLMVDPGATKAGIVRRFCQRMEIELLVHEPGAARVNGSVEKGQDIVERTFESRLKFHGHEIYSFDDLNREAELFQLHFNRGGDRDAHTGKYWFAHSRHSMSRFDAWGKILPEQLRVTPPEDVLLSLATKQPEKRSVSGDMTVNFRNRTWNVVDVPGVTRGGTVHVHWHPFQADTAMAVIEDADGRETHFPLPEVTRDEWGFPSNAVQIANGHRAMPDTVLETNRKEVMKRAAGTDTITATEAVRKGRSYRPFNGEFNALKAAREAKLPPVVPRAGTELDVVITRVEARKLTTTAAAIQLQELLGDAWRPEYFQWIAQRYPDGIAEDHLERLAAQWSGDNTEKEAQAC